MNRLFFTLGLSLFLGVFSKAQTAAPPSTIIEAAPLQLVEQLPIDGTYQILIKTGTEKVQVSDDILKKIDSNRQYDKEFFLKLNENARIKILPFTVIQATDFKPLEKYAYEN
jgi:hypothetical protein